MKQIFSLLLVVVSLLGILDASYITYEELSGRVPSCIPPFECGAVLNSEYSHVAGIPISALGVLFYLTMFVLSILNVTEVNISVPITKNVRGTIYLLSFFGFLFSLYLISLMQFVIGAWCLWCLISATTSTTLFVLAMLLKNTSKKRPY